MPPSLEEATIDYLTGYVPDPACAAENHSRGGAAQHDPGAREDCGVPKLDSLPIACVTGGSG